jgi:hypothetical protein
VGTVNFRIQDAGVAELFMSGSIGLIVAEGDEFSIFNQPDFYPLQNQGQYWSTEVDLPEHGVFTIGFAPVMRVDESLAEADWQVYPNPANDVLNIASRFIETAGVQCRVVDLSGRVVAAWPWSGGQRMAVDVSAWPSGVYVVEFEKDGLRHALPFMKQ